MALSTCRSCTKPVSDTAPICPHCMDRYPHGAAVALGEALTPIIGIVLGIMVLLSFLGVR